MAYATMIVVGIPGLCSLEGVRCQKELKWYAAFCAFPVELDPGWRGRRDRNRARSRKLLLGSTWPALVNPAESCLMQTKHRNMTCRNFSGRPIASMVWQDIYWR